MEFDKNVCPVVDIQGQVAGGKQFDLEIIIPEDGRDVIYGVVKDCHRDPIKDAVVKLIEVDCHCDERKPVSHTFTDEYGQFVFGPLCGNKEYEVQIWVNKVKHVKVCAKCDIDEKCLKGVKMDKCDKHCEKHCEKKYEDKEYDKKYEKEYEDKKYDKEYDKEYEDKKYDKEYDKKCEDKKYDKDYEKEDEKKCKKDCECKCEKQCERPKKCDYPCIQYPKNNYYR